MDGGITINIPLKKNKKFSKTNQKIILQGYIELKNNCLKYFYGTWIKCINKQTRDCHSGGFLTKIDSSNIVYLRSLQSSDLLEFNSRSYIFFAKENSEQYQAMQKIEIEKDKIRIENNNLQINKNKFEIEKNKFEIEKNKFEIEKNKFEKIKYNFFKLFQDGKIKIINST